MAYIDLKVRTTFDFGKLSKEMPSIIEKVVSAIAEDSANASKKAIQDGLIPSLRESTKKIRKLRGRSGDKPLLDTGELYNSIRFTKEGLTFKGYGQYQREGFTPKKKPMITRLSGEQRERVFFVNNTTGKRFGRKITVPARDFVRMGILTRNKKGKERFVKAIGKALKK